MTDQAPFWSSLRAKGDSLAVIDCDSATKWTYTELDARVTQAAEQLQRFDRSLVLLFADNDVGGIVCYLAALVAGHALFMSPRGIQHSGVAGLVDRYEPDLIVWRSGTVPEVLRDTYESKGSLDDYLVLRRRLSATTPLNSSLCLVLSTSASTGSAKGVRLSSAGLAATARQVADGLSVTDSDRALLSLPLSYVYGLSVVNSSLQNGGALLLAKGTFADQMYYGRLQRTGLTTLPCVTPTMEYMRKFDLRPSMLPALRRLTHAGSRLDSALFSWVYEHLGRHGVKIFLMYGQTEAGGRISILQPGALPEMHASVGRPLAGGSVTISPEGEIIYRGPGVMLGYARCREDLSNADELLGVLRTGDLGRLDEAGNLFVTGRLGRHCKVFGHRVNLDEVEDVARTDQPAAALENEGVIIVVFEGDGGVEAQSVKRLARRFGLPPQVFRFQGVTRLPRTANGKICYRTLQSML